MAVLVDSYSETNRSTYGPVSTYSSYYQAYGQSFTSYSQDGTLNSCKFYLMKTGSPTGNGYAKVYAHTGTYGTSSVPTGAVLATSDAFDVSTLTTSYVLTTLTFSGAEKITLTASTYYCVVFEYTDGSSTSYVRVGSDNSSPTHGGNRVGYISDAWSAGATADTCFYVYIDDAPTTSTSTTSTSSSTTTTSTSRTTSTSSSTSTTSTSSSTSTSRTTSTSSSTTTTSTSSSSSTSTTSTSSSTSTTSTSTSTTSTSSSTSITTSTSTTTTIVEPYYCSANYIYRKKVTIDGTKVGGSSNLTNFPFLFNSTDASLAVVASGGRVTNSNGYDIIFIDNNGNQLSHEIEKYVSTTGEFIAWVKIPTVYYNQNTYIWLNYGNSNVSTSQENVTGVWDASYKGVWHLKEDPTGTDPAIQDSTSNSTDASNVNMLSGQQVTGQVDGGLQFNGDNKYLSVGTNPTNLDVTTGSFTIEALVKSDTGEDQYRYLFNRWDPNIAAADQKGWRLLITQTTGTVRFEVRDASANQVTATSTTNIANNSWHHLMVKRDVADDKLYVYVDGVEESGGIADTTGSLTNSYVSLIGSNAETGSENNRTWNGYLDELRFSSTNRAGNWALASANNQLNPGTFYSIATEETCPATTSTSITTSTSTTSTSTSTSSSTTTTSTSSSSSTSTTSTSSSTSTTSTSSSTSTSLTTSTSTTLSVTTSTSTTSTSSSTTTTSTSTSITTSTSSSTSTTSTSSSTSITTSTSTTTTSTSSSTTTTSTSSSSSTSQTTTSTSSSTSITTSTSTTQTLPYRLTIDKTEQFTEK